MLNITMPTAPSPSYSPWSMHARCAAGAAHAWRAAPLPSRFLGVSERCQQWDLIAILTPRSTTCPIKHLKSDWTPLLAQRSPFFVRAIEIELPTWFGLALTKNSCAAIGFLFRLGIAFRIAEAISQETLIGPCDGSTTRFTASRRTWLKRVRHVCKIDCQFLLGRYGRCSGTSAWAVGHGDGPIATPWQGPVSCPSADECSLRLRYGWYGFSPQLSTAAAVNQVLAEHIVLIGPRKDVV